MVWVCPYCQGTRPSPPIPTAGKAHCPFCRRPVKTPLVAEPEDSSPGQPPHSPPFAPDVLQTVRERLNRRKRQAVWTWGIVGVLGALVLVGTFWGLWQTSHGLGTSSRPATRREKPIPEHQPPPPLKWSPHEIFVARTLEQARQAVVKIEIPLEGGAAVETGTGFFIGDRGWIATNNHLVQNMNSRSYVRSADGQTYRIAGIVAQAPEMDLAILQLAERPAKTIVLDLSYDGTPPLGSEVYAIGHPYNVEFSLSRGIVSRVLTTGQLIQNFPDHIVAKLRSPPNMVWIQHDAKISPGNSGGPLIDAGGRVLGVNTFVHRLAQYGFASHIRYLRELMQQAKDATVQTLPEPTGPSLEHVAPDQIVDLSQIDPLWKSATEMAWAPRDLQQYRTLAELARIANIVKYVQVRGQIPEGVPPQIIDRAATQIEERFVSLQGLTLSDQAVQQLNALALSMLNQVHSGVVCIGVVASQPQRQAVLLAVGDPPRQLLLRLRPDPPELHIGQRVLLVGLLLPQIAEVRLGNQDQAEQVPVVLAMFVIPLNQSANATDQGPSSP